MTVAAARGVLVSFQRFELEPLDAYRRFWGVSASGLWVHIVEMRSLATDENRVPTLGFGRPTGTRSLVGINLAGRTTVSVHGRTLECGAGILGLFPGRGSFRSVLETSDDVLLSLILEVDSRVFPAPVLPPTVAGFAATARLRARVAVLCSAIETAWRTGLSSPAARLPLDAALDDVLVLLWGEGVLVPRIRARDLPDAPEGLRLIGKAVDRALSQADRRPMMIDLEAEAPGCARTIQRAFPALCEAWGQRPESFREHRQRVVLGRAFAAMMNPRATTGHVARALGFSSPNAFCRAVTRSGLPAPRALRERGAAPFREE